MRKKLIIVNTVIVASLLLSMTLKRSSEVKLTSDDSKVTMSDTVALTLLKFKCFVCHNPDMNAVNRVAPPMFKVREHYLDNEKTTSAEFVQNILRFINDPSESNSIMPGAVRNFGLMPKMYLNEADIRKIAEYLYAVDVSSDSWYAMWEKTKDILKADESRKT